MKQMDLMRGVFLLTSLIIFSGSGIKSRDESFTSPQSRDTVLPEYILKEVRHYHYEESILRMEASFEEGEYYASSQELYIENCNFVIRKGRGCKN